jgi:hypothetical protein
MADHDKSYQGKHRDPEGRRRKPGEEGKPVVHKDLEDTTQRAKEGKPPRKP